MPAIRLESRGISLIMFNNTALIDQIWTFDIGLFEILIFGIGF